MSGEAASGRKFAAQEDEDVFTELYPALRRLAAIVSPPEVDPDDLVQEAVARALTVGALADLRNPRAYLSTTVIRLAANDRRSLGRRRRALHRLGGPEASSGSQYPSDIDVLAQLSVAERAVVYLSVVEGRSAQEVAELVGSSAAAVRMRRSRALRHLRALQMQEEAKDA